MMFIMVTILIICVIGIGMLTIGIIVMLVAPFGHKEPVGVFVLPDYGSVQYVGRDHSGQPIYETTTNPKRRLSITIKEL